MDEQELSILYRPRINIERDYHSDGIIQHEPVQNIPEEVIEEQKLIPDIPTPLEQVATEARQTAAQLLRIRNITEVLPPPIQDTTQKLIDTVITTTLVDLIEVEDIEKEKKYDVYPSTEEEPDETETEPDDWPVMTSSDFTFVRVMRGCSRYPTLSVHGSPSTVPIRPSGRRVSYPASRRRDWSS